MGPLRACLHSDVCANVLGMMVQVPIPARQYHAIWATSGVAARRVWHCWPRAVSVPGLAAHQKDSTGPKMSGMSHQPKEISTHLCSARKVKNRVVKPMDDTLSTLWSRDATRERHYCSTALGLITLSWHRFTCSLTTLTLLQKGSCFLGHWWWLSLLFLHISGGQLQLVTCRMGWNQGSPYTSSLYSLFFSHIPGMGDVSNTLIWP